MKPEHDDAAPARDRNAVRLGLLAAEGAVDTDVRRTAAADKSVCQGE